MLPTVEIFKKRNIMKKSVLTKIFLFLLIIGLITGCSQAVEDKTTTEGTTQETSQDVTEESSDEEVSNQDFVNQNNEIQVAVFYYTYEDNFIASIRNDIDNVFETSEIEYYDYDAGNNQDTQLHQIDIAIQQGANILVVNQVNSGNENIALEIVEKAKAADAYLIFFNRPVEKEENEGMVLNSYEKCAFVGTNPAEAGHMQGKIIGNYLLKHYEEVDKNKDGVIQYALLKGQEGNVEATYRTRYSVEDANMILEEAEKPKLEYFDSANPDQYQVDPDGTWSEKKAKEIMQENFLSYGKEGIKEIEVVISNNDGMAIGAIGALNELGYNLGGQDESYIPVFGVDAIETAKQLIEEGKMTGTIKQDREGMANAMIHLIANGLKNTDLMENTEDFVKAENCHNKIYIPYGSYTSD